MRNKIILIVFILFSVTPLKAERLKKCSVFTRIARTLTDFGSVERALTEKAPVGYAYITAGELKKYVHSGNLGNATDIMEQYFAQGHTPDSNHFGISYAVPTVAELLRTLPNADPVKAADFLGDKSFSPLDRYDFVRWTADHMHIVGAPVRRCNASLAEVLEHQMLSAPIEKKMNSAQKYKVASLFLGEVPKPSTEDFKIANAYYDIAQKEFQDFMTKRGKRNRNELVERYENLVAKMVALSTLTIRAERMGLHENLVKSTAEKMTEGAQKVEDIILNAEEWRERTSFPGFRILRVDHDYWTLIHPWSLKRPQERWENSKEK